MNKLKCKINDCSIKPWEEGGVGYCERHTEMKRVAIGIVQDAISLLGDNMPSMIYEQLEKKVQNHLAVYEARMNPVK